MTATTKSRGYSYKELRNDLGMNHVPEPAFILAFDTIMNQWMKELKRMYSTYSEYTTNIVFASVDNIIVRISFTWANVDAVDYDERIMMFTSVFMTAEKEEPLDKLKEHLLSFIKDCKEEEIKKRVRKHLKDEKVKTYHLASAVRKYYDL